MAIRVIALLMLSFFAATYSVAQEEVKSALFEDCDEAIVEYGKLNVEQQTSLLHFFARVVALNTQSPSAPEVFAVIPSGPHSSDSAQLRAPRTPDFLPGSLWQNMDAKRELRAKRCAIQLLQDAGSLALVAVPALVRTYSEQPLSDEIAVAVEESTALIAEKAHNQNLTPTVKELEDLIPLILSQHSLVARNLIHEYRDVAIPILIRSIAQGTISPEREFVSYLTNIDSDYSRSMRAFINLLPALNLDQAKRVIAFLPIPKPSALSGFVDDFIRLATDPAHTQLFLPILGETCVLLKGFTIDAPHQQGIASIPLVLDEPQLAQSARNCLIQSSLPLATRFAAKISELLVPSATQDQHLLALKLLEGNSTSLTEDSRRGIYNKIAAIASDVKSPLRKEALSALTLFPDYREDSRNLALALLKSSAPKSNTPHDIHAITTLTFDFLLNIGLGKESSRFNPYIIRVLRSEPTNIRAIQLATQAAQLDPEILKTATATPPLPLTQTALSIITARKELPKNIAPALVELLRYPELQLLAENGLNLLGPTAVTSIRKSLARIPSGAPRLGALAVLANNKSASKSELSELVAGLNSVQDCSFSGSRPNLFCSLSTQKESDPSISAALATNLRTCINQFNSKFIEEISRCAPELFIAAKESAVQLIRMHGTEQLAPRWIDQLIETITTFNPVTPEQQEIAAAIIAAGSDSNRVRILNHLNHTESLTPETLDAIRVIVEASSPDSMAYSAALETLAIHKDQRYDWSQFIKEAIKESGKGIIELNKARIISLLPEELVLAEVAPALESDKSELLIGASLVGSSMGAKAVPIVSKLWALRTHRAPSVRYAATLALLRINPLTPDLSDAVKRLLVNRYFPLAGSLPIKWSQTVALNDLDRGSFGVLRRDRLARLADQSAALSNATM